MRSVSTPPYRLRKLTAPSSTTISGTLSAGRIIAIGGSGEPPRATGPPPDRPLGEAWTACCRRGADLRASAAAAATLRASRRERMGVCLLITKIRRSSTSRPRVPCWRFVAPLFVRAVALVCMFMLYMQLEVTRLVVVRSHSKVRSLRSGPMQPSPRGERPGSARPTARPVQQRPGSARPRGAENRQVDRFSVGPKMRPDELPKFGLQYHAKFPERRPQSASPRSPRSPRNASPRAAPLTTARVQSSHGFEPAGFKHPWGGLPDAKRLPWMQYGAQCTLKERPTSAHAANRAPAEFHKAVMKEFVDAANADGELDDAERLALTTAKVATASHGPS